MAKHNIHRKRFDFSKIPATIQIPNLIEVQKRSYERFLQMDRLPSERDDAGLQADVHDDEFGETARVHQRADAKRAAVVLAR